MRINTGATHGEQKSRQLVLEQGVDVGLQSSAYAEHLLALQLSLPVQIFHLMLNILEKVHSRLRSVSIGRPDAAIRRMQTAHIALTWTSLRSHISKARPMQCMRERLLAELDEQQGVLHPTHGG